MTTPAPLTAPAPPTVRRELTALARLAGPPVGANLLQMAVSAVDMIFVARLGTVELAAATLGVFLFNLLMYAMIGLGSASAALIAAELGARSHAVREVRRSFRMALWVAAIAAVPVIAVLLSGERLFLLAGQDPEVARRAGGFLHIIVLALVPGAAAGILRSTAAALGRAFWAFVVTGMALLLNIVANWAFIRGHLGVPAMGLNGSAVATVVSMTAMLLACTLIASLRELGSLTRREIASLVGVAPMNNDSGRRRGHRFVMGGRGAIRNVLYMATLTASGFNKPIKTFYGRLCDAGKPPEVALTACMRKLLTILNAMVRDCHSWRQEVAS